MAQLYDRDIDENAWLEETADYVLSLGLPNLAATGLYDYLIEMGKSDKRALKSQVVRLIHHLLKFKYQSQKASGSWKSTCRDARNEIFDMLKDSPSLQSILLQYLQSDEVYDRAKDNAEDETGVAMPDDNPFTPEQIMDRTYFG